MGSVMDGEVGISDRLELIACLMSVRELLFEAARHPASGQK
jgi:hypothetical protein